MNKTILYIQLVAYPLAVFLGIFTFNSNPIEPANQEAEASVAPKNVVLILADDQPYHTLQYMPNVKSLLVDMGVKFNNAFATTPLCCPSRSSVLSGQYGHNHGVLNNKMPKKLKDSSTIATWLKNIGYYTGYAGKYLNGYDSLTFTPWPYLPPGWDKWLAWISGTGDRFYNYSVVDDGVVIKYGSTENDYSTSVYAKKALDIINNAPSDKPLFLMLAPNAPHAPAKVLSQDTGAYKNFGFTTSRSPSYNEADVNDKPKWVRDLPLITSTKSKNADIFHRRQIGSLQAIDRTVKDIVDALTQTGRIDNTVIIYTADNGLSWGEHRWLDLKICPYEECARVPLVIRGPGITPGTRDQLAANIDIAATIAELTGATPDIALDGQSLVPILNDATLPGRSELLLEYRGGALKNSYSAVRTATQLYAEYANGDKEFYDLTLDPFQMTNTVNDPANASVIASLKAKLDVMKVPRSSSAYTEQLLRGEDSLINIEE
ncbi:MAG: sulfatase [Candidatus Yanofskybacteria bacterium]|nr:sulfatase [Candidatus Yanofskybacteria bacterium]